MSLSASQETIQMETNNNDVISTNNSSSTLLSNLASGLYTVLTQQEEISIKQLKQEMQQIIHDLTYDQIAQHTKEKERKRKLSSLHSIISSILLPVICQYMNDHEDVSFKCIKQQLLHLTQELSFSIILHHAKIDKHKRKRSSLRDNGQDSSPLRDISKLTTSPSKVANGTVGGILTIPSNMMYNETEFVTPSSASSTSIRPSCARNLSLHYDDLSNEMMEFANEHQDSINMIEHKRKKSKFIRFQHDFGKELLDQLHPVLAPNLKYVCIVQKDEHDQDFFKPIYIEGQKPTQKATDKELGNQTFVKTYEQIIHQSSNEKRNNLVGVTIKSLVATLVYNKLKILDIDIESQVESAEQMAQYKQKILQNVSISTTDVFNITERDSSIELD